MTEILTIQDIFNSESLNEIPPLPPGFVPRGYFGQIIKWAKQGGKLNYAVNVGISMMSFCASRRYYSPTMSPVHLYTVAEGPGATGKKQVLNALIKLMTGIEYQSKIGPSEFEDTAELESFLENCPRSLILMSKLEDMQGFHEYWSSNESVSLQDGKSIFNPAPVLVIKSLAAEFKKILTREEFLKGTAGRLLVFNETKMGVNTFVSEYNPIDTSVLTSLKQLADGQGRDDSQFEVTPVALKWNNLITKGVYNTFKNSMTVLSATSDLHEACYGEAAEMAGRIATLSALGRNSMTVDTIDLSFAMTVVLNSANYLYSIAIRSQ